MCSGCSIDIYDAMHGVQKNKKNMEVYDDVDYYYDELLANSLEADKGAEYDGKLVE